MSKNPALNGKVAFITGASRGIGRAIALRLAREGAGIIVTGKTVEPHPKLPGTINSVVEEIKESGGKAIAVQMDLRFDDQVEHAIEEAVNQFGGIDFLINNASAIYLAGVEHAPMKRVDLMHAVNLRGTYLASRLCLPHLKRSDNPHLLMLSPPINLSPKWFEQHLAYTLSKYGMSMCVIGMSEEFRDYGIKVNALWPRTLIATAAVKNLLGGEAMVRRSRKPEIVAESAFRILSDTSSTNTGNFYIDEEILLANGITDLSGYAVDPSETLQTDLFLDDQA